MPARGSGKIPRTSTSNGAELAQFAGVSGDTIKNWRRVPDFPGGHDGPTVLLDFAEWIFRRDGVIPEEDADQKKAQRFEDAELRKVEAEAVIKEAKARQELGQLVDRIAALTRMSQLFAQVRARLQAIPQELASALPPNLRQDITRDFEGKIRLILTEMVAWGRTEGLEPETLAIPPSATSATASTKPKTSRTAAKRSTPPKNRTRSRGPAKT